MLLFYAQTEIEHRAGEVPGSLQPNVQSNSFSFGNVTDAFNMPAVCVWPVCAVWELSASVTFPKENELL